MTTTRAKGAMGEEFACARLEEDGYRILVRGYRVSHSEIDIIARKEDTIAFVEVKLRSSRSLCTPAQAVSRAQRKRIVLAAVAYLKTNGIYNTGEIQPRFDLFEIETTGELPTEIVRWFHMKSAYDTGDLHVFI